MAARLNQHPKEMKLTYAIVIEQTPNNFGTYAPDVQGCISTAATPDEMPGNIREALAFKRRSLRC